MERMFNEWLAGNGAEIEAMIFRSPQPWCPDQYIFRFRGDSGPWSETHIVPWGMDSFARVVALIRQARP